MFKFAFMTGRLSMVANAWQGFMHSNVQPPPSEPTSSPQLSEHVLDEQAPTTDEHDAPAEGTPAPSMKRPADSTQDAPSAKRHEACGRPSSAMRTREAREKLHGQRIQADYHYGRAAHRVTKTHIGNIAYLGPDAGKMCLRVDWDDGTTETYALSRLLARGTIMPPATEADQC